MINRPVSAFVLFMLIALLGIYALLNIPIEFMPDPKLPEMSIVTQWHGMQADTILERVTLPLEENLMLIRDLVNIESITRDGSSIISIEMNRDADLDFNYILIQEVINNIKREIPSHISIRMTSSAPLEFRRDHALSFYIGSEDYSDINHIREIFEREMLPVFKTIHGIREIKISGGSEPILRILVDTEKMQNYEITVNEIYNAVENEYIIQPSSTINYHNSDILLNLSYLPDDIIDIEKISIKNVSGKNIKLSDIANISYGYADQRRETRYNGRPSLIIEVEKQQDYSILSLEKDILSAMRMIQVDQHGRFFFEIIENEAEYLREKLRELILNAVIILLVIFIILLLIVRSVSASILIISSIIFSFLATILFAYLFGISMNIFTISALIICFGMFVDNAVVIFDNIMLLRQKGENPKNAACIGSKEVFFPVIASTITTIIVFFSFVFFEDRLRLYYLPVAKIVGIALLCSAIIAYLLIPTFSCRIPLKIKKIRKRKKNSIIKTLIKYPIFLFLPLILFFLYSSVNFGDRVFFGSFLAWRPPERLYIQLSLPDSSSYADTKQHILTFENAILEYDCEMEIIVNIYDNHGWINVIFPNDTVRQGYPFNIRQTMVNIASGLAGVRVRVSGFHPMDYYSDSEFRSSVYGYIIYLRGYNFERLLELAERVKQVVTRDRRVTGINIITASVLDSANYQTYMDIHIDKKAFSRIGLSLGLGMNLLFLNISDQSTYRSSIKLRDRDYNIELSHADYEPEEIRLILNKRYRTEHGNIFSFKDLVNYDIITKRPLIIERKNQEYIAQVRWNYDGPSEAGLDYFYSVYNNIDIPAGFGKSERDHYSDALQEEEKKQLHIAIIIAFFLVIGVLAFIYNSVLQALLAITAVPLALIGIFWGFILMRYPFDSSAYIGLVLVLGIVVNNSILLVNHINIVKEKKPLIPAIVEGTTDRIRPVLITTITTITGSLVFIVQSSIKGEMDIWTNFAFCNLTGLLSSSLLIFFVLPPIYYRISKPRQN